MEGKDKEKVRSNKSPKKKSDPFQVHKEMTITLTPKTSALLKEFKDVFLKDIPLRLSKDHILIKHPICSLTSDEHPLPSFPMFSFFLLLFVLASALSSWAFLRVFP
ncbi:hypothetical protein CR513_55218, partial [Mucuna pruriens]